MKISILDQVPITDHTPEAGAIDSSLQFAVDAERLGYQRIWFAEHHHSKSFACSAPEMVAALALERTTRIRVGTGGILLPFYAPEKVAEAMTVLGRVHGDRVDPGVGQGSYGDATYPARIEALVSALGGQWPGDADEPEGRVWVLGSGTGSAPVAGRLAAGYVHAHFLNPGSGEAGMLAYRDGIARAAEERAVTREIGAGDAIGLAAPGSGVRPHSMLAVRVIVADTGERAAELARATLLWRVRKDLGHDGPIPSTERAAQHEWTDHERARAAVRAESIVYGTPAGVRARLTAMAEAHLADELMLNTLTSDPADRLESYRLLAEAFDLG